ncbi:anti-sigma factor family protein [Streptomyces profundus]|uniref:anti-sigma factor family protein n=1 Tax=Streptomyces profundus TaxID=2867410 RepID=UPI001D162135|nr:hypothetical protein [Streptomyces sp. MA3_2.13]UED85320.1 hypothetical protein K4G22_14875 [Streptomyces sp. MA3_2.13]
MTETHPEPAEIAALDEDLLPAPEAAELRAHLAGCDRCAEVLADLVELRAALRDDTDPGPMPEDIALRIDAALANEPTPVPAPSLTVSVSRETPRPRRLVSHKMALAAAGAVLAVGMGSALIQVLGSTGGGADGGSSAADAGGAPEARDDFPELPVESLEGQVRELLADSPTADAPSAEASAPEEESTEQDNEPAPPPPPSEPSQEPTESVTEGASPESFRPLSTVPTCVDEAIGRSEEPLAVNEEDYNGVNAYLVVLPHTEDPELVTAYVVDAACVSATPPVTGEILLEESYVRE